MVRKLVTVAGGAIGGAVGYGVMESALDARNKLRMAWVFLLLLPFLTIRGVPGPVRFALTSLTAIGGAKIVGVAQTSAETSGGFFGGLKAAWSAAWGS